MAVRAVVMLGYGRTCTVAIPTLFIQLSCTIASVITKWLDSGVAFISVCDAEIDVLQFLVCTHGINSQVYHSTLCQVLAQIADHIYKENLMQALPWSQLPRSRI